ncbi:MAG: methionine sulfoxide reductase heme-binding subunit [Candidatus Binatota bacterium]|jgi:sulfoxide reductase heme-binding subunit YedZ|nr:methionine sulfoxide reductase heme-binding subunit [Candidatus Binatota bacterium]
MISWLKPLVFLLCLIPFGQLAYNAYTGDLGVNPIETITRFTGSWALIFLLGSLAVTPLRRLTRWNELIKFRRMLGLFAFSYALAHFSTYLVLDLFFDWAAIGKDILKRPYVTAGFTAFVLMIPLAITSTAAMIRRLGKRWQQLHRLVYLAAIGGVIHFYWLVKADIRRPAQYGAVLALLLGYRLVVKLRPRIAARFAGNASLVRSAKRSSMLVL